MRLRASWKGGKIDERKDVFGVVEIEEEGVKVLLVVLELEVEVEAVKVEAEYVLAEDQGLLAENEALVGENRTAAFLFNRSLGVGGGQFQS